MTVALKINGRKGDQWIAKKLLKWAYIHHSRGLVNICTTFFNLPSVSFPDRHTADCVPLKTGEEGGFTIQELDDYGLYAQV